VERSGVEDELSAAAGILADEERVPDQDDCAAVNLD
jgi:hypothetical protein